jgi:hypothetical protein
LADILLKVKRRIRSLGMKANTLLGAFRDFLAGSREGGKAGKRATEKQKRFVYFFT